MQTVETTEQLAGAINRIKQGAARFTTNWFVAPEQAQTWIGRGNLSHVEDTHSLLIFRRDRDFYHIYHAASDHASLARALSSLSSIGASTVAADLVGRPADVNALASVYQGHGFEDYQLLFRMVRTPGDYSWDGYHDPQVAFAGIADALEVNVLLNELLDPLVDQIPELDEIRDAAERRKILIVRCGNTVAGILLFEATGLTAILRYWYARHTFRNQGIGARLMKTFFYLCRSSKRIILWVIKNNADAVAKYQHYGFREEVLVDRIMILNTEFVR
jgi:GNAT superfamily N-acetyltransferase